MMIVGTTKSRNSDRYQLEPSRTPNPFLPLAGSRLGLSAAGDLLQETE